jgi:hypothetical protein
MPFAEEVRVLHESVMWSGQTQFEQMKLWRMMNYLLGVPAAVLAAIAGGTGLAATKSEAVPGVLALMAGGFSAALTTLNPSRRVTQAQASANAYLELQTVARQLLTVRLPKMSRDDAEQELSELTARRDEVNKVADPPGRFAYWRAKKNFNEGGQDYADGGSQDAEA